MGYQKANFSFLWSLAVAFFRSWNVLTYVCFSKTVKEYLPFS